MQYLYRVFDEEKLLYIGISNRWHDRIHSHEKDSEWFELATRIELEKFETREDVEAAERRAIRTERPHFNKVFNEQFETVNQHFQVIKFWTHHANVPVDDSHAILIEKMREDYRWIDFPKSRTSSKFAAWIFVMVYMWLDLETELQCRNCDAIFKDKQVNRWVAMAQNDIEEGGTQ